MRKHEPFTSAIHSLNRARTQTALALAMHGYLHCHAHPGLMDPISPRRVRHDYTDYSPVFRHSDVPVKGLLGQTSSPRSGY